MNVDSVNLTPEIVMLAVCSSIYWAACSVPTMMSKDPDGTGAARHHADTI